LTLDSRVGDVLKAAVIGGWNQLRSGL
jgi:hypothetical protein